MRLAFAPTPPVFLANLVPSTQNSYQSSFEPQDSSSQMIMDTLLSFQFGHSSIDPRNMEQFTSLSSHPTDKKNQTWCIRDDEMDSILNSNCTELSILPDLNDFNHWMGSENDCNVEKAYFNQPSLCLSSSANNSYQYRSPDSKPNLRNCSNESNNFTPISEDDIVPFNAGEGSPSQFGSRNYRNKNTNEVSRVPETFLEKADVTAVSLSNNRTESSNQSEYATLSTDYATSSPFNLKNDSQKRFLCNTRLRDCDEQHIQGSSNDESVHNHSPINTKSSRKSKCTACGELFSSVSDKKAHILKVHKSGKFPCLHCERTLKSAENLRRHMMVHSGNPTWKCHYCGGLFGKKVVLSTHISTCHSSEARQSGTTANASKINKPKVSSTFKKSFRCDDCKRSFSTKSNLGRHIKNTHLKARSYQCKKCGMRFNSNYNMNIHYFRVHQKAVISNNSQTAD